MQVEVHQLRFQFLPAIVTRDTWHGYPRNTKWSARLSITRSPILAVRKHFFSANNRSVVIHRRFLLPPPSMGEEVLTLRGGCQVTLLKKYLVQVLKNKGSASSRGSPSLPSFDASGSVLNLEYCLFVVVQAKSFPPARTLAGN